MGKYMFDQYSLLHFSVGVVVYFWGIRLPYWIIIHTIFEIVENSKIGMNLIDKLFFWPGGGKPLPDSFSNIIGDSLTAVLGWLAARYLDKLGTRLGWYQGHII